MSAKKRISKKAPEQSVTQVDVVVEPQTAGVTPEPEDVEPEPVTEVTAEPEAEVVAPEPVTEVTAEPEVEAPEPAIDPAPVVEVTQAPAPVVVPVRDNAEKRRIILGYFRKCSELPFVAESYATTILQGIAAGRLVIQPVVSKAPVVTSELYSPDRETEWQKSRTSIRFVWNSYLCP